MATAIPLTAEPARVPDVDDFTAEELAEIDAADDEAEDDAKQGRCIPAAEVLAKLARS